jgi:hypothetical protein
VRSLARHKNLYLECFLAAVFPLAGGARVVVVVPTIDVALPAVGDDCTIDELLPRLPPFSVVLGLDELPTGETRGDAVTYAWTMGLWERLHKPFVAAADQTKDPVARVNSYRRAIEVDYACELAHQKLSDTAKAILHQSPRR